MLLLIGFHRYFLFISFTNQVVVKLVEELKDKYAVHLIYSCFSDTEKYFKAISGYDTCGDGGILVKKIE